MRRRMNTFKNLMAYIFLNVLSPLVQAPMSRRMNKQVERNYNGPDVAAKLQLQEWVRARKLYALVDPFFEIPSPSDVRRLETKDTDPVFYEVIAWDKVT